MRRRHVQTIREEERPTLLLMAAGAVVGAAAGLFLGRRYRTMDSFVEDMRDKFYSLRDVWYEAEELGSDRRERVALADDDELDPDEDDIDVEEDEEEFDDLEDDEVEARYETEDAYHEDVFEDDDDDDIDEDEDEFEEELAAVGRDNGVSESSQRAADAARQLEERVLVVMREDPVLRTRNIEIAVVGDGVVELSGNVQTIEEVSRAAAEVRGTPGVSMVLNRLEVRTGGTVDTASVARDPNQTSAPEGKS